MSTVKQSTVSKSEFESIEKNDTTFYRVIDENGQNAETYYGSLKLDNDESSGGGSNDEVFLGINLANGSSYVNSDNSFKSEYLN